MARLTPFQARKYRAEIYKMAAILMLLAVAGSGILLAVDRSRDNMVSTLEFLLIACSLALTVIGVSSWRLRLFCPCCGKYIEWDIAWRCSYCDAGNNLKSRLFPFIHRCGKCKTPPKCYICQHCETSIPLDADNDTRHPARAILPEGEIKQAPEPDLSAQRKQAYAQRKEEIEQEIEITELNRRLEQIKLSPEFEKKKSAKETLMERFSEHDAHVMGIYMLKTEIEEEIAKTSDPDLRERRRQSLEMFVDENIST